MPALRISVGFVVKPLIQEFAAISLIPVRSAPSAKSLTFSAATSATDMFVLPLTDMSHGGPQRRCHVIGPDRRLAGITALDLDRVTASAFARLDVAPTVTYHIAALQGQAKLGCRLEQHACFRLAARTSLLLAVHAHPDVVHAHLGEEAAIHRLEIIA